MKPSVLAAVLALGLAPLAASAEGESTPVAAAPTQPAAPAAASANPHGPWSLGAGVGWSFSGSQLIVLGGPFFYPPAAPSVRASLERAVAPGLWLEMGVSAAADRLRGEAPAASGAVTRSDRTSAALDLGLRRALTRPGAPVCVSVDLALVAGYAATHLDWAAAIPQTERGEAWEVGLASGLAVERELTSGLSLRVGTPLFSVRFSRMSAEQAGLGKSTRRGVGASLALAPFLELRQAF